MMAPLIALSILTCAGWLLLPRVWRGSSSGERAGRQAGLLASNRRGTLPALLAISAFTIAGWMLVFPSHAAGATVGLERGVASFLFAAGFIFAVIFGIVFISGRPAFIIPPSMRAATYSPPSPVARKEDVTGLAGKDHVTLLPDEVIYGRLRVNRVQAGRAFGGHLYVTSRRLIFVPVSASQANGGSHREIPLGQVSAADVAPRGINAQDGSLWHRLRVTMQDGDTEYFVVWRPRQAVDLIERARRSFARA
jgi:hypothetical protein